MCVRWEASNARDLRSCEVNTNQSLNARRSSSVKAWVEEAVAPPVDTTTLVDPARLGPKSAMVHTVVVKLSLGELTVCCSKEVR